MAIAPLELNSITIHLVALKTGLKKFLNPSKHLLVNLQSMKYAQACESTIIRMSTLSDSKCGLRRCHIRVKITIAFYSYSDEYHSCTVLCEQELYRWNHVSKLASSCIFQYFAYANEIIMNDKLSKTFLMARRAQCLWVSHLHVRLF